MLDCRPRDLPELAEDGLLVPVDGDPPKYAKDDVEQCRLELERRHAAMDEFRRIGEELFGEEEVALIGADSLETVKRTHSRYFSGKGRTQEWEDRFA